MPDAQPPIDKATWTELVTAASQLAALEPWKFATEGDVFGLTDPATGEVRLGHVLGDGSMVYAVVIYRKGGISWLFSTLNGEGELSPQEALETMDCVKLEWVLKRDMEKEDLAAISASGIKIPARGSVWPQFRSSQPGWHPWHINAGEARQLVSDLRQLIPMVRVFKVHPELFDDRLSSDTPFLRADVFEREPGLGDLEWRSIVPPPEVPAGPVKVSESDLAQLKALRRAPNQSLDFDARLMPGAPLLKDGRPCLLRLGLAVETHTGLLAGFGVQEGDLPPGEAAASTLIAILLNAKLLPAYLNVGNPKFKPAFQPLCTELGIQLGLTDEMGAEDDSSFLDEAFDAMETGLMGGL